MKNKIERAEISELVGKVAINVFTVGDQELIFTMPDGVTYNFYHEYECCENVYIEDICGDLKDLVDSPILLAEQVDNIKEHPPKEVSSFEYPEWTYYKFATIKGRVTVRFYGTSNGYYSTGVSLFKYTPQENEN